MVAGCMDGSVPCIEYEGKREKRHGLERRVPIRDVGEQPPAIEMLSNHPRIVIHFMAVSSLLVLQFVHS